LYAVCELWYFDIDACISWSTGYYAVDSLRTAFTGLHTLPAVGFLAHHAIAIAILQNLPDDPLKSMYTRMFFAAEVSNVALTVTEASFHILQRDHRVSRMLLIPECLVYGFCRCVWMGWLLVNAFSSFHFPMKVGASAIYCMGLYWTVKLFRTLLTVHFKPRTK